MNTLIPNIPPHNDEVLYVIGNGFDLSHGIESSYRHFAQWVKAQGNNQLIGLMDTFFSNKRSLWSDVETALGNMMRKKFWTFVAQKKVLIMII